MKKSAKNNKNPIDPTAITYKVNHATKAIELSATAAKKASQYGSFIISERRFLYEPIA